MLNKPTLYFRHRRNGASVFRVTEDSSNRMEMLHIATIRPNGEIKAQSKYTPTTSELDQIETWHKDNQANLAAHNAAKVDALVRDMNLMAQWIQADSTDQEVSSHAEPLLMAIHDLRITLVRQMGRRENDKS